MIESPQGATSIGRCKVCAEVREFRNSAADTLWEGDGEGGGNAYWNRSLKAVPAATPVDDGF